MKYVVLATAVMLLLSLTSDSKPITNEVDHICISPKLLHEEEKRLLPWLAASEARLKSKGNREINTIPHNKRVVYKFSLGPAGEVLNPVIVQSSGARSVDESVLTLIKSCSPLQPNHDELIRERGLSVEFTDQYVDLELAPRVVTASPAR